MKLILASASPRRKDLLKDIGIKPDHIVPADIEETPEEKEKPKAYALRMAREKALAVSKDYKDAYILGADTVVKCGQKILHKASGDADVQAFLKRLSGRRHHVYTAVAVITPEGKVIEKCSDSWVKFKQLDQSEIFSYVKTGEGIGKAGGYAIQGKAACLIKDMAGSYSGVVGLPLYETANLLKQVGFKF